MARAHRDPHIGPMMTDQVGMLAAPLMLLAARLWLSAAGLGMFRPWLVCCAAWIVVLGRDTPLLLGFALSARTHRESAVGCCYQLGYHGLC